METVATYFISIVVFVVVIFVVRDDFVVCNRSIIGRFVFILNISSPHLCCVMNVNAVKSKVHHEWVCRFETQHISASPGVIVRSLCGLIVVLFLFRPSSPVRIFKSIAFVH